MDFQAYRAAIARLQSSKWTPRQKRLNALSRVLKQKQYSHIGYAFSQERENNNVQGKRILLDDRRPSVQDALAIECVREQCGLIFGEARRPLVLVKDDKNTTDWIAAFIADTKFWLTLMDALWKGSVGSCAVVLRVLGKQKDVVSVDEETQEEVKGSEPDGPGRYYFEVWAGEECRPVFDPSAPDELLKIDRRYFIGDDSLAASGYDVEALKKKWDDKQKSWRRGAQRMISAGTVTADEWVVRLVLDRSSETRYLPVPRYIYERQEWKDSDFELDKDRTFNHDLGSVPVEWIRPLPLDSDEYYPDGACMFEQLIDPQFRIDRSLSQIGRAFDYAGDPQMARIKGSGGAALPSGSFGTALAIGGTASDQIEVESGGEAKFVEISGEGLKVAIETYVKTLEDIAKRSAAMSRVTPDAKSGSSQPLSAAAMEMLNAAQLTLSGILRITCGELPGSKLIRLGMKMYDELDVDLPSLEKETKPKADAVFEWQWPRYYERAGQEKLFEVQAIGAAAESGGISQETAVANYAPMFDVVSVDEEMKDIEGDKAAAIVDEVAHQTAINQVPPPKEPAPATGSTGAK